MSPSDEYISFHRDGDTVVAESKGWRYSFPAPPKEWPFNPADFRVYFSEAFGDCYTADGVQGLICHHLTVIEVGGAERALSVTFILIIDGELGTLRVEADHNGGLAYERGLMHCVLAASLRGLSWNWNLKRPPIRFIAAPQLRWDTLEACGFTTPSWAEPHLLRLDRLNSIESIPGEKVIADGK